MAAWSLHARQLGLSTFDELIPDSAAPGLSCRQQKLASVPLVTYGMAIDEIIETVNAGHHFIKIKLGADPDKDGSHEKMLAWDKNRISEIHAALKKNPSPHTESGRIAYYFDANGR